MQLCSDEILIGLPFAGKQRITADPQGGKAGDRVAQPEPGIAHGKIQAEKHRGADAKDKAVK